MQEKFDERRFRELIVESEDLQSDAMKGAKTGLDDYVEAVKEARFERGEDRRPSPFGRAGAMALGAGVVGAGVLAFAGSASASTVDVQALQTAAGIENLAVLAYKTALTLPYIGGSSANAVVKAFAMKTMAQHADHAAAFNAAVTKAGGKTNSATDPTYTPAVTSAAKSLTGASASAGTVAVVKLAIQLEDVAAETYTKNVGLVSTQTLRGLFASVAGVEAQHKAILLAVQALVGANLASEIKLPPTLTALPKAAGSVGFPDAFYKTTMAAAPSEGAVK